MKKTKTRLESTNFLTNMVILVFIALGVNGIETTLDPVQTVQEVMAKNMEFIIQILIPALITIGAKVTKNIQAGTFSFKAMIKSPNFISQAIVVLAGILGGIGIMLPETAPTELTTAIFGGSVIAIIGAVIANVLNPLWHFLKPLLFPPKDTPAPVKPR
jgi:hypothetical protein